MTPKKHFYLARYAGLRVPNASKGGRISSAADEVLPTIDKMREEGEKEIGFKGWMKSLKSPYYWSPEGFVFYRKKDAIAFAKTGELQSRAHHAYTGRRVGPALLSST